MALLWLILIVISLPNAWFIFKQFDCSGDDDVLLLVDDAIDVEAVGVGGVGGGDRGSIVSNMTDDDSSLLISSE